MRPHRRSNQHTYTHTHNTRTHTHIITFMYAYIYTYVQVNGQWVSLYIYTLTPRLLGCVLSGLAGHSSRSARHKSYNEVRLFGCCCRCYQCVVEKAPRGPTNSVSCRHCPSMPDPSRCKRHSRSPPKRAVLQALDSIQDQTFKVRRQETRFTRRLCVLAVFLNTRGCNKCLRLHKLCCNLQRLNC